jgi:hypothetical protein
MTMDYEALTRFVQDHFTDGLALVIGSGLSCAETMPGMPALAEHLCSRADSLSQPDRSRWGTVKTALDSGDGLEAALLKHPPSESLEAWISRETCALLVPKERAIMSAVLRGDVTLRLTTFLSNILRPNGGLPILTPNYDRLIEVACEMAGLHVDTTAIGHYAGSFDAQRSCMASCMGTTQRVRGGATALNHFPRAIVLKPHGSFDWYKLGDDARRCSLDLDADRLIITPGLHKYQAGYNAPFNKHFELANGHIRKATRLLIVGYGFNDGHIQTELVRRIRDGTPTLILNRQMGPHVKALANEAHACVCLSRRSTSTGVVMTTREYETEFPGADLWDLGCITEELLI